jgi:hypothetical protein
MLKPNRHTHHPFARPATHVTTPLIPAYHTHYHSSPQTTSLTPYSTTITFIAATTITPLPWPCPPPSHRALGFLFLLILLVFPLYVTFILIPDPDTHTP